MLKKDSIISILILIVAGVSYRFFSHPANFSPVAAVALFSGFFFRRYFIFIPIIIMFISDFFIGFYDWKLMIVVYLSFAVTGLFGIVLRKNRSLVLIAGFSLFGSMLFFVLTNFAVWFFTDWYNHNLQGLLDCYAAAVPFFRNTLLGDLFYNSLIFGCYEILVLPREKLSFFVVRTQNNLG